MTKLSKHFSEQEFLKSNQADKLNIDNSWANPQHKKNATHLCENYLEVIRQHFQKPIVITSGYRVPELNAAVNGSRHSEHMVGQAADFKIIGFELFQSFEIICNLLQGSTEFNQLILENGWIHLGIGSKGNQKQEILSLHPSYIFPPQKTLESEIERLEKRIEILEKK